MASVPVDAPIGIADAGALELALPPLSLYVHIPWCVRKCPYCDFNSHVAKGDIPEGDYCRALVCDLQDELPNIWGRRIGSVYFGGGTPSLFSAKAMDGLLADIRALVPIVPGAEITVEANPGTVESGKVRELRSAGINRISIGVQTFDDRMLSLIGRIHDGAQARRCIEDSLETLDNVNIDLMHALPEQELSQAVQDVRTACEYAPPHISAYNLTIEPGTVFERHPPKLPGLDDQADISDAVAECLESEGYSQYEISAFSRPGRQCVHNMNYWRFGDYVGIGCGAHGKLTRKSGIERTERVHSPASYMRKMLAGESACRRWTVPVRERLFEFALNAFRIREGFNIKDPVHLCGISFSEVVERVGDAESRGLASSRDGNVRATELGWRHMNDLISLFME